MNKNFLIMSPGPTTVPPEVLMEGARPILHHRTPEFREYVEFCTKGLQYIFQTKYRVFNFVSTGTGAMESAVANLINPGDKAIAISGGKFGERWVKILKSYQAEVVEIKVEWSTVVTPEQVEEALKNNPDTKVVYITLTDTSAGGVTPVKAIGEVVKNYDAVLVVDAVSGLLAEEFKMDEWNVDVTVSSSQKGVMLPPGLAFAAVNDRAFELSKKTKSPKFYFDWKAYDKKFPNDTPYTAGVSLMYQLKKSLEMIKEETVEHIWLRHKVLADATRAAIKALGMKLLNDHPNNVATAVLSAPLDGQEVVKIMREKYGIIIAGGQEPYKGKIFRLGHLGYVSGKDVITMLGALEMTLRDMGYDLEFGKAVAAALPILREGEIW
jgi:aspartate aminotransferase-like enzyme